MVSWFAALLPAGSSLQTSFWYGFFKKSFHPFTRYQMNFDMSGGKDPFCYSDEGPEKRWTGPLLDTVCACHMQRTLPYCISLGNEIFVLILWILSGLVTRTRYSHRMKPEREIKCGLKGSMLCKIPLFPPIIMCLWPVSELPRNKTGLSLASLCLSNFSSENLPFEMP